MAITYKPYEKTSETVLDEVKLPYSVLADAPDLSAYVTKSGAETISGVKTFTSAPKMDTLENSRGNAVYHFNGTCAYFGQTTFPVCLRGNEIRPKYLQGGETTASPLALYDDLGNYVPTQSGDGTYYAQVENENGEVVLRSFKNGDTVDTSSVKVKKDGTVVLQGSADRPKYQKGGNTAVDIALKSDIVSTDNFVTLNTAQTISGAKTIGAGKTLTFAGTSNTGAADIKFGTVNSKTPYFGYAKNQSDGTFLWSITGTDYATGLAIGGGSGNLLWKGKQVATVDQIPNVSNYATKTEVSAKYTKPSGGIPKTDLASAVQTSLGKADTALQSHQDISGKANLSGGNTFTGKQILTSPPSDNYSIDAAGYIKGSWGQFPSTGKATSNTNKVCVLDGAGWIYYRTPAEIVADGGGASEPDVITLTETSGTLTAEQLASAEKTDTVIILSNLKLQYAGKIVGSLYYATTYFRGVSVYMMQVVINTSTRAYTGTIYQEVTTTTTQSISGKKTFNGGLNLASNLLINNSAGTAGQVLTSQGSDNAPTWSTPSSGGKGRYEFLDITVANTESQVIVPWYDATFYACISGYMDASEGFVIMDTEQTEWLSFDFTFAGYFNLTLVQTENKLFARMEVGSGKDLTTYQEETSRYIGNDDIFPLLIGCGSGHSSVQISASGFVIANS